MLHICTSQIRFFWSKYVLYYFLGQILFYKEGYASIFHLSSSVWCSPVSAGNRLSWNPQKVAEMRLTAPTTGSERRLLCFPLVFLGCLLLLITSLLCPVEVIWFLFLTEPALSLPSSRVKIYMWGKKSWSKPSRPSFCGFWSQSLRLESPGWAPDAEAERKQSCSTYLDACLRAPCAPRRVFVLYSHWISSLVGLTVTKIISFSVRLKEISFSVPTYLKIRIFLPFLKSSLNLLQYCFCCMLWFFGHTACRVLAPQPGIELSPFTLEGNVLTTGPPKSLEVISPSFSCIHILLMKLDVNLVLVSLCVGWYFFSFWSF